MDKKPVAVVPVNTVDTPSIVYSMLTIPNDPGFGPLSTVEKWLLSKQRCFCISIRMYMCIYIYTL